MPEEISQGGEVPQPPPVEKRNAAEKQPPPLTIQLREIGDVANGGFPHEIHRDNFPDVDPLDVLEMRAVADHNRAERLRRMANQTEDAALKGRLEEEIAALKKHADRNMRIVVGLDEDEAPQGKPDETGNYL